MKKSRYNVSPVLLISLALISLGLPYFPSKMFPGALEGTVFSLWVIGDFFKELETKKRVIHWIPSPPQSPFYLPAVP